MRPIVGPWLPAALLLVMPGCGSDDGSSTDTDAGTGADASPSIDASLPVDAPPFEELHTEGIYDLTSPVDITASALFPQPVYQYYDLLRQFRDDPAATLFTVLSD